jgi:hypothetical protein
MRNILIVTYKTNDLINLWFLHLVRKQRIELRLDAPKTTVLPLDDFRMPLDNRYYDDFCQGKKSHKKNPIRALHFGGLGGIRTLDQRLKRPLLYRLSYKSVRIYNKNYICGTFCQDFSTSQK